MKRALIALISVLGAVCAANAQFFDTSRSEDFFRLGVRVGFNMSNVSANSDNFVMSHDSWGSGFEGGVVADISLREWFSLQPGIFYQSRSNSYTHIRGIGADQTMRVGHTLYYSFYIPVMFVGRFNLADRWRWSVEAGPYLSLGVGHNDNGLEVIGDQEVKYHDGYFDDRKKNVWGLKFGTGIEYDNHYYLGIHYMAGFGDPWKYADVSGRNKAWTFTLGYNF